MYQQDDYDQICAQLRRRRLALFLPAALGLVLVLVSFLLRWPQAVTVVLTVLVIGGFVFCYSMFISPVVAYRKHIEHALHGHTHDTQGVFVSMEKDSVIRDGVALYPFIINVGAGVRDDGNRLFYYDANLPRPDWREGETLLLTSYDNRVTAWTRARLKA